VAAPKIESFTLNCSYLPRTVTLKGIETVVLPDVAADSKIDRDWLLRLTGSGSGTTPRGEQTAGLPKTIQ